MPIVPSRYTIRIVANGNNGTRFELFDTEASRSVKSYQSHAVAVSDMLFLNSLLAPTRQAAGERSREPESSLPLS